MVEPVKGIRCPGHERHVPVWPSHQADERQVVVGHRARKRVRQVIPDRTKRSEVIVPFPPDFVAEITTPVPLGNVVRNASFRGRSSRYELTSV